MSKRPLFQAVDIAGEPFLALDVDHPDVVDEVTADMGKGVAVYYDRRWDLTGAFCRFLMEHAELVRGRRVLAARQLRENGVRDFALDGGSFDTSDLSDVDMVVACFVVYDDDTRDAMSGLLQRAAHRGIPVLLANEDVGPHFQRVLDTAPAPVETVTPLGRGRVVRVG